MNEIAEITQLILRERQGRDRGWWAQMRGCFHEDSTVKISWYQGSGDGFVTGSEKMSANGNKAVHRLSPPVIHLNGTRAVVEVPSGIEFRAKMNGVEADLVSYARLQFRVEQRNGVWKIFSFDSIYERDTLTPAVPGTVLKLDPEVLSRFRPTYRFIGYHLHTLGYSIPADLYGDDQPEQASALYRSLFEWAGLKVKI